MKSTISAAQQSIPMFKRCYVDFCWLSWCHKVSLVVFCIAATLAHSQVLAETTFSIDEQQIVSTQGPWPQAIPSDPGNALSGLHWAEVLGQSLFFDASLSKDASVSCGSCHQPENGFADALSVGVGAEIGVRNTQGLLDVGLQRWFGWDGGADSLWAASLRPLFAKHEMANTVQQLATSLRLNDQFTFEIRQYVNNANSAEINLNDVSDGEIVVLAAKSIAAYTRTLRSDRTPFDQFRDALLNDDVAKQKAYPESAKRGLKLFLGEANCHVCHFGADFSNGEFHDTGRPFFTAVGQVDPGRYKGIQRVKTDPYNLLGAYTDEVSAADRLKTASLKIGQVNWGQWRTPSLRNLTHTAPYMHDGSLASLRDVVDAYADIDPDRLHAAGESILKPLPLSDEQRNDLVAFLMSLSTPD